MGAYKRKFIDLALEKGVLTFGDFTLKSGRKSPYFFNSGHFDDGDSIRTLGSVYASAIVENVGMDSFDVVVGPAYKGIPLCVATAISLNASYNLNKGFSFDRKVEKGHGDRGKMVGTNIEDSMRLVMVDDVLTTGGTKVDLIDLINEIAKDVRWIGLVISLDRGEIGDNGKSAREEFESNTGIPVYPVVDIADVVEHVKDQLKEEELLKIRSYLEEYGTEEIKKRIFRRG